MEDNKVEQLLTDFADNLGHFDRHIPVKRRAYWKPVAITAVGAVTVSVLVFMPRQAEAAPMEKMANALKTVGYWRCDNRMKSNTTSDRSWRDYGSQTYWNGVMQYHSGIKSVYEITTTVKDGFAYDDFAQMPYILKAEVIPNTFRSIMKDPLEHALLMTKRNPGQLKRKDGVRYHGTEAYTLSLKTKDGITSFEATIQKSNDLPLLVQMELGNKVSRYHYESKYSYNPPHPQGELKLDPRKEVLDVKAIEEQKIEEWSKLSAGKELPLIFESSVAKDGSVWVTYAGREKERNEWQLESVKGVPYAKGLTYLLGNYRSGGKYDVGGLQVMISKFYPVRETSELPKLLEFQFQRWASAAKPDPSSKKWNYPKTEVRTVKAPLKNELWNFPRFLPASLGKVEERGTEAGKFYAIADWFKEHQDYKAAIKNYELGNKEIQKTGIRRLSPMMLTRMAECYDKLGDKVRAKEFRRQAEKNSK